MDVNSEIIDVAAVRFCFCSLIKSASTPDSGSQKRFGSEIEDRETVTHSICTDKHVYECYSCVSASEKECMHDDLCL
jgi:hypothetical protein